MVVTRSMSRKADTENAVRDKVTEGPSKEMTVQRAQVTNAKSGTSQQEVDAEKICFRYAGDVIMIVAKPRRSDKYFDLDERFLAMGIFIDTLKQERLKNDPDFAFTWEFYRAAMRDFNSLNDDNKAMYIAEAEKRNTIKDNDVAASKKVRKSLEAKKDLFNNLRLEAKASCLYYNAVKVERRKNGPDFSFVSYMDLNDDDKAPYLAEATAKLLDVRVESMKQLAEFEVRGYHLAIRQTILRGEL